MKIPGDYTPDEIAFMRKVFECTAKSHDEGDTLDKFTAARCRRLAEKISGTADSQH